MTRVCLYTGELYPFTAGGIGRLIYNLVMDSYERRAGVELHLLLPAALRAAVEEKPGALGEHVRLHYVEARDGAWPLFEDGALYPPAWAFKDTPAHAHSLDVMLELKRLARSGLTFDVIEFPDYHGVAICTLQEKRLGLAFGRTEIAVRLHSTFGIIRHVEGHSVTREHIALHELERKALYDADRVVAHLAGVAEYNRSFYGFGPDWMEKVSIELPPIEAAPPSEPASGTRDVVFSTKVQRFKRPDLFLRGAAAFVDAQPDFSGDVVFACRIDDDALWAELLALWPRRLQHRLVCAGSGAEREARLRQSLAVFSSDYESLCLAAYEASALGATPILNAACAAFSDGTPWRDGENCYKFDGSVEDLARALARAHARPQVARVELTRKPPYWERDHRQTPPRVRPLRPPLVSVILNHHADAEYLPETLESIAASNYPNLEVVVVDDASTDPLDEALVGALAERAASADCGVRVVRNPVKRGTAASRNLGVAHARGEYLLPLDVDDAISSRFIEMALFSLEQHGEYDGVVPQAACFVDHAHLAERRFCDYASFLGDAPSLGLLENRLGGATALFRRSVFDRVRYDERLPAYADWAFYLHLVHSGGRLLATNQLDFYRRVRPLAIDRRRRVELIGAILDSLPRPLSPAARLFPLAASADPNEIDQVPLRHKLVDRIDQGLKRIPYLRPLLRRAALELSRRVPRKGA
jgi:glycosyltransferase involved in cell wall biosynthesis